MNRRAALKRAVAAAGGAMLEGDYYMFPRRDGIVLGGTHDRGEWRLDVDPLVTDRILSNHRAIFERMR